jgi:hypothetical protein
VGMALFTMTLILNVFAYRLRQRILKGSLR